MGRKRGRSEPSRSEPTHSGLSLDDGWQDWLEVIQLEKRAGLAPEETLRRLRGAIRAKDRAEDHTCFYMADVADRQLWTWWGHPTLAHFAVHRLGVEARTARSWAKVGRELRELPGIRGAFEAGEVGFTEVRALVKVATPETEERWLAFARQISDCKRLESAVTGKTKGDLPTDPSKRRIHDPTHKSVLRMTDSDHLLLQRARALCEARVGGPLTDLEVLRMLASDALCHELVDERPGWKRVSVTHFQILASPNPGGDPDELVSEDEDGQPIVISRSALEEQLLPKLPPRELVRDATIEQATAKQATAKQATAQQDGEPAGTKSEAGAEADASQVELVYTGTSALDPRNDGPFAPEEERAAPTSSGVREQVLKRDRRRCLVCGSRENLAAHHLHWRRYGGPTTLANLATTCERCHSLIHARRMVILGDMRVGLTILDGEGKPYRPAPRERFTLGGDAPDQQVSAVTAASAAGSDAAASGAAGSGAAPALPLERQFEPPLQLTSLPAEVDSDWLRDHMDQLAWNDRQGALELLPERLLGAGVRVSGTEGAGTEAGTGGEAWVPPVPAARLDQLVGQSALRDQLRVAIEAARVAGIPLRHLLFSGGPGLGKTLLSQAVAGELGAGLVRVPAQLLKSPDAVLRALLSLTPGAVLFMDEIQALGPRWAELLYEALEPNSSQGDRSAQGDRNSEGDRSAQGGGSVITLLVRQGLAQRALRVRLPAFTFVGATTDEDLVPAPLRSRLEVMRLAPYADAEMAELLMREAEAKRLQLTPDAAARLAGASRATPRTGLQLLDGVRDEAVVAGKTIHEGEAVADRALVADRVLVADRALVDLALGRRGIDGQGLTPLDRDYLAVLKRAGGPVALATLAAELDTSEAVLREVVEPHLKRLGLIRTTPRGRVLARRGLGEGGG